MAPRSNGLMGRISRAMSAFRHNPVNLTTVEQRLDTMIASGELPTMESKQQPQSRLDVRHTDHDIASYAVGFNHLRSWIADNYKKSHQVPPKDSPERDWYLSEVWKGEPILAGAVYSMSAKMTSLKWMITGKRKLAVTAAKMLARSAYMGGYEWGGFQAASTQDFYTTNRGVFWETAKAGDPLTSMMTDIGHIDTLCCTLTGNSKYPLVYVSEESAQRLKFQPGEFIHFASLASPREHDLGGGMCAVDRALRAAQMLMGLHDYDEEKLSNLPPEGVASVTGLTMDEFDDAIKLWMAKRQQSNSLTFPQVLWLIASQPSAAVGVEFTGFSQIPESFDRKSVIEQYVNTLALCFGVDAREFWSLMSGGGLGTAGESEIQHMKAKGKGPGEYITTTERHINGELPDGIRFQYDTQDMQEDASAAAVAKAWVDAFMPLYNLKPAGGSGASGAGLPGEAGQPAPVEGNPFGAPGGGDPSTAFKANPVPNKPNGAPNLPLPMLSQPDTGGPMGVNSGGQSQAAEQVIDKNQLMRLLVDKGVLPDWMMSDNRTMIEDSDIHNRLFKSEGHQDDYTKIIWEGGVLKEVRPDPIVINSRSIPDKQIPYALPQPVAKVLDFQSINSALEFLQLKEQEILASHRGIHGEPIPEGEVTRGYKPSRRSIHDELERWRNHPILAPYAMTPEEEVAKFGKLEAKS